MHAANQPDRDFEEVPLENIETNPDQPRQNFDEDEIDSLAESINKHGLLHPLTVSKNKDGSNYYLISGERRYRALLKLNKKLVHVHITDGDQEVISLIENIQRQDLHPLDEADAFQKLMSKRGWTQQKLADEINKNRSTIANSLKLNKLTAKIKEEARLYSWASKSLLQEIAAQTKEESMDILWDALKTRKINPTVEAIRQGISVRKPRPQATKMIKAGHRFVQWLDDIDSNEFFENKDVYDEIIRIKKTIDKKIKTLANKSR